MVEYEHFFVEESWTNEGRKRGSPSRGTAAARRRVRGEHDEEWSGGPAGQSTACVRLAVQRVRSCTSRRAVARSPEGMEP